MKRTVLEVCGVDFSDNGRSCDAHVCCGTHENHCDIIYLQHAVPTNDDGVVEDVVKAFKVDRRSGLSTCHISYLPTRFLALHDIGIFDGVYLYVDKEYRIANSCIDTHKLYQMGGLLRSQIIIDRNMIVGHNCNSGDLIVIEDNLYLACVNYPPMQKVPLQAIGNVVYIQHV
jgi:hypothetical protein